MKNIKPIYWYLASIFMIATIIFSLVVVESKDNKASTFLSGLAVVTAILAMALSDKKLPKFIGIIKVWTSDHPKAEVEGGHEYKLSIRIENTSEEPVNDIKIKIRTPERISNLYDNKNPLINKAR